MSINSFLDKMNILQKELLNFLENQANTSETFTKLTAIFENLKINANKNDHKAFLRLLIKVSNNHYRGSNFFDKIFQILKYFEKDLKINYSNSELFDIFKSNKRILLFLIDEKIIIFDNDMIKTILSEKYFNLKYPQYFLPEIEPFMNEPWFPKDDKRIQRIFKNRPENFECNRRNGENENIICKLIQNDSKDEFIDYINKNKISHDSEIPTSIYETNHLLNNWQSTRDLTLILYAAFYGSIQIFQFLEPKITYIRFNYLLWPAAIHSNNLNLIHLLEKYEINKEYDTRCFHDSIKCHHNQIANYFQKNHQISKDDINIFIKNYNFAFLQPQTDWKEQFYFLCRYDYYTLVLHLLNNEDINGIVVFEA